MENLKELGLVALMAVVPVVVILLFAMIRGYSIKIDFSKKPRRDDEE